MSNLSYDYDSAAVRREARKIKACRDRIESAALPRIKDARSALDDTFKGRTADALDNSLDQAQSKLKALYSELNGLYSALMHYADAIEEADEKVSRLFRNT